MRHEQLTVGELTVDLPGKSLFGLGAKNGATVSVAEYGDGVLHKTVLTLTAMPITLTDDSTVGQFGGVKIYDMPAGNVALLGAVIDAVLTLTAADWTDAAEGDVGLGSTVVDDGDALATTEQNIVNTTAIPAMTAQVGSIDAMSNGASGGVVVGTTASPADIFLNVRIDDAAAHITDGGFITGTVTLLWSKVGDA
jgi:hypothetical protein